MHKTADSIEEAKALKETETEQSPSEAPQKKERPAYQRGLVAPWKPGQSGNPSGRPKNDLARQIAQAIFENNGEAAYNALSAALLKGNAYVFKELAERAYGKLKETHQQVGPDDGPIQQHIVVTFVKPDGNQG